MLTTREIASLVLIGAVVLVFLVVPTLRKHMARSVCQLLRAVLTPRLIVVYLVVVVATAASTTVSWWIGL